jgi:hypothetical protein
MRIEFEFKNKEKILIMGINEKGNKKQIGQIFTPSSSAENNLNAIQICGFDEAFDLWGCGVFGDKETGEMKKDIQLCWNRVYDTIDRPMTEKVCVGERIHPITEERMKTLGLKHPYIKEKILKSRCSFDEKNGICHKCFNHPCTCENLARYENPYTVKREQDLYLIKKKDEKSSSSDSDLPSKKKEGAKK